MKRLLLLTAALCAPLLLAGCDSAGLNPTPSAATLPATASTASRTGAATTDSGLGSVSIVSAPATDTAPSASDAAAVSTSPMVASRSTGGLTYTATYTRSLASKSPEAGDDPTQDRDRRTCEFGEDPSVDNCDSPGGNTWYPGPPGPVALIAYDSDVRLEGYSNAEVVAFSQAVDRYYNPTPIDYMWVAANTTDGGALLGSGAAGGANLHTVVLAGSVPRPRAGRINLCQASSHRFKITGTAGTSDNTYWESDCETWD